MNALRDLTNATAVNPGTEWVFDLCSSGWVVAIILALALLSPTQHPHEQTN